MRTGPSRSATAKPPRCSRKLHQTPLPHVLPVGDDLEHVIPPYDAQAMLIEVELFLDWYLKYRIGTTFAGCGALRIPQCLGGCAGARALRPAELGFLRGLPFAVLILSGCLDREGAGAKVGLIDFPGRT